MILYLYFVTKMYNKNRQVTEIYLRVKNDTSRRRWSSPYKFNANLLQSYGSSVEYGGWIRDEVAIHFDIFTVRTVQAPVAIEVWMDRTAVGFFPLYLLE